MTELQFLKCLLNHRFYKENKGYIVDTMFPDNLLGLYKVISDAHERYERDISVDELRTLFEIANPTLPRARKTAVVELITDIAELEPLAEDVVADIMVAMWRREIGRQLAEKAIKLMEGKTDNINDIKSVLDAAEHGFLPTDGLVQVTSDVNEVLELMDKRTKWQFNIPSLNQVCPGISGGEFMVVGARPNAGKTAFPISLSAAEGGFCHQGAVVHYFGNEEPVIRTRLRSISACTGMTYDQIIADKAKAKLQYDAIADKLHMYPAVGLRMSDLDMHVAKYRPDIVVLDQLDKLVVDGKFSSDTDKLRVTYIQARGIAIKYDCSIIGLSQASADAEGKEFVTYSMLENSKTGKGAEADLIVGIGMGALSDTDSPSRCLYISKNKLTGFHGPVYCLLDKFTSRYMV